MGWTDSDLVTVEVQDEGSMMLEITPMELGKSSARVFLDEVGQRRLLDQLIKNLPGCSMQEPCTEHKCDSCKLTGNKMTWDGSTKK